MSHREGEWAAVYQTKDHTPNSLACVGREVEVPVGHCAKPVFYLSTWGKSWPTNERKLHFINIDIISHFKTVEKHIIYIRHIFYIRSKRKYIKSGFGPKSPPIVDLIHIQGASKKGGFLIQMSVKSSYFVTEHRVSPFWMMSVCQTHSNWSKWYTTPNGPGRCLQSWKTRLQNS